MRHGKILGFAVLVFAGLCTLAVAQTRPNTKVPGKVAMPPTSAPAQNPNAVEERNKVVVRKVFDDLFSHGRYEEIPQIYARNCVVHHDNKTSKLDESIAEGKGWRAAAPDMVMTANKIDISGDMVMVDWTAHGTNTGKGNGVPATGKRFVIHGNSRFRLVNGQIVEVWNNYSRDELFRQLGVNPTLGHLYEKTQELVAAVNRYFAGNDEAQPSR